VILVPAHLAGIVNRYYLRPTTPLGVNGDSWSLWLLDQDTCSLSIVSDYGNWAHLWGRDGVSHADWRVQFLSHGAEYIADKLSYGVERVFDAERVAQNIRESIVARRRNHRSHASPPRREAGHGLGMIPPLRFTEADANDANDAWRFSCGPAAICALLGMTPDEVRPHLGNFRGWMNPTQMGAALNRIGKPVKLWRDGDGDGFPPDADAIWRLQFEGPWMAPNVPVAARYKHTHYVAFNAESLRVFDVNWCFWHLRSVWVPMLRDLIQDETPKAFGTWHVTHAWEVQL
jgi:hypothetical protein